MYEQVNVLPNQKIIDRVKKMLFKAQDTGVTEAEAQSCVMQAQAIMAKYQLKHADVAIEAKLKWWEKQLADVVARNFRCYAYWSTKQGKSVLKLVGLEEDVEVAHELYSFAKTAMKHLSMFYLEREGVIGRSARTEARNAWLRGFIVGLHTKLAEQVEHNGWLSIIEPHPAVKEAKDSIHAKTVKVSLPSIENQHLHFENGYQEGYQLDRSASTLTQKGN